MPFLAEVARRQWALPILAELGAGRAARIAPLCAATGAGRPSARSALLHLDELALIERNPGHGHPLRPEWRLTASGTALLPVARAALRGRNAEDPVPIVVRRRWGLPVVECLTGPRSFGTLRRTLEPVTDRALSLTLKDLEAARYVCREVESESHPPRAAYRRVDRGRRLGRILDAWGAAAG